MEKLLCDESLAEPLDLPYRPARRDYLEYTSHVVRLNAEVSELRNEVHSLCERNRKMSAQISAMQATQTDLATGQTDVLNAAKMVTATIAELHGALGTAFKDSPSESLSAASAAAKRAQEALGRILPRPPQQHFRCHYPECSKLQFRVNHTFQAHMRAHAGFKHVCTTCSRRYPSQMALLEHIRQAHPERPPALVKFA